MKKNSPIFAFLIAVSVAGISFAQESVAVEPMSGLLSATTSDLAAPSSQTATLSLQQAIEESLARGSETAVLERSLGAARLQRSLDLAKQGITVSAGGSWSLTDGISQADAGLEQSLLGRAESASLASSSGSASGTAGIGQSAQGSLTVGTPQSKISVSVSQSLPPSSASNSSASTVIGVSGSQVLWDGYPGGQVRGTLEKSRLTLLGKELSDTQARSAALTRVKQSYITMLSAQRDLAIKLQVLEKMTNLLAQIQAIYDIRQASAIDLKTAQINARGAGIDARTAEKTLRLANERLALLIGREEGDRFAVAEIPDPPLPASSAEEAIRIGLSRRADLAQFALSAQSAGIDAALARATKHPLVSLTGGAGVAMDWSGSADTQEALSVGAKITLPVYDSGAATLQAKAGQTQADIYGLQAAQLRRTVTADIRDYFETTQLLAEKTELTRMSAELAEAQFELVKTQNKYGTATMQDVLTASVTAATAEVNYGTVKNQYLLAELSLETAMGL